MPMLWLLRFMLMLPISIAEDGKIRFRWWSLPVAVTFLAWLVIAVLGVFSVHVHLDPIRGDNKHFHVWDLVPQYCGAFNTCYIFCLPYTSWAATSKAISMLDQWQRVEDLVSVLRGSMPVPGLRRRVWFYSFLSISMPVSMFLLTLNQKYASDEPWMAPITIHLFGYSMLAACFWNLSCRGLAAVARQQASFLVEDFQRLGVQALHNHRSVWLGMVRVLDLLSCCWGRVHSMLLLMSFVSFVSVCFLLICLLVEKDFDRRFFWLMAVVCYCFSITASVCNSAHIATDAMRRPTMKQLLQLSLTHRDKATLTEIWRFLYDINISSPKVTITGLAILSRTSIISFFTLANTYIFVVSQFAISVENTESNFSEDPFLLDDY
ncbi:gustatory and odorant receptor 22-like [Thrips palmi]|uniref:Gustatory receptor n=1 Tax=Thrips palmi TaxID=161013 RepID=A0A6P8YFB4_THRPL|nr:gustatory and odorant receptor 22-like [Thrips palmi]